MSPRMDSETMPHVSQDSLAHWWWPGQWLRIVCGVWIDQVWYWQTVRPRLYSRRVRWSLLLQGLLGAALVALFLTGVLGGIIDGAVGQIHWIGLSAGVLAGVVVGFGVALLITLGRGPVGAGPISIPFGVVLGVVLGVELGTLFGLGGPRVFLPIAPRMALGLSQAVVLGFAVGVGKGVANGADWTATERVIMIVGVGASLGLEEGVGQGIATGLAFGVGLYFGGRWALRQVPDPATRRRLANPRMPRF